MMLADDAQNTTKHLNLTNMADMAESSGLLSSFAQIVGSSEDAVRLLLSIVAGYPIAFVHRKYLYGKETTIQYIYFIITGLIIGWFNFGVDMIHPLAAVLITHSILLILGGNTISVALVFIYNMTHLLIGYAATATNDYDIKWTMPQCVLTLRLIGLAFNYADGQESLEKLSAENKNVALRELPSLLEVFAHNLYPPSFLIGPQLPLIRMRRFVTLTLQDEPQSSPPDSLRAGLLRGALGALYLCIFLAGSSYITDDYMLSEDFNKLWLWKRFIILGLWGRIALYKYICCWLLTEGACIVMGLTYNGRNEVGTPKWDGCSNVKVSVFESATRMNHYIESFNINTNHWVAQYIYKRLKFLNNRTYSQLGVLLFLAVWHGFHSGYYATFFFEFVSLSGEKAVLDAVARLPNAQAFINKKIVSATLYVLLRLYTLTCMGYAMISFILLKHRKYLSLYWNVYFGYHIVFALLIFGLPFITKKFAPRPIRWAD